MAKAHTTQMQQRCKESRFVVQALTLVMQEHGTVCRQFKRCMHGAAGTAPALHDLCFASCSQLSAILLDKPLVVNDAKTFPEVMSRGSFCTTSAEHTARQLWCSAGQEQSHGWGMVALLHHHSAACKPAAPSGKHKPSWPVTGFSLERLCKLAHHACIHPRWYCEAIFVA